MLPERHVTTSILRDCTTMLPACTLAPYRAPAVSTPRSMRRAACTEPSALEQCTCILQMHLLMAVGAMADNNRTTVYRPNSNEPYAY